MTDDLQDGVSLQPNKGGRPRKLTADKATIDQITGMAAIFCTKSEVCAVLRVSRPTLDRFFADNPEVLAAYEDGFGAGQMSLRRKQFKLADKNAAMAIFLGKNVLGQSDKQEHQHTGAGGGPIQTVDLSKVSDDDLKRLEHVLGATLLADTSGEGAGGADQGGDQAEG